MLGMTDCFDAIMVENFTIMLKLGPEFFIAHVSARKIIPPIEKPLLTMIVFQKNARGHSKQSIFHEVSLIKQVRVHRAVNILILRM